MAMENPLNILDKLDEDSKGLVFKNLANCVQFAVLAIKVIPPEMLAEIFDKLPDYAMKAGMKLMTDMTMGASLVESLRKRFLTNEFSEELIALLEETAIVEWNAGA